ncbi:MAG: sulfur carrier protein ThiS, partial [Pseudomonadota bacterium]
MTLSIIINGEPRSLASHQTLDTLLKDLELDPTKVAVERNLEIVPKSEYPATALKDGDTLEIVHFIGGGDHGAAIDDDALVIAGKSYSSRLIVGTGKYKDFAQTKAAVDASGAQIVTVAVRRV